MDLKIESKGDMLIATMAGRLTLSEAIEVYMKICDAATERGSDRVLVDCFAVEGELPILDRYELGRTIAEYCLRRPRTPKVATVGKPPTINGFAARVAWNRGLVAETFTEMQRALDWLH